MEIEDEPIPQGPSAEEESSPTDLPDEQEDNQMEIEDEPIPQGPSFFEEPDGDGLPKTGGISGGIFTLLGAMLISIGRKNK